MSAPPPAFHILFLKSTLKQFAPCYKLPLMTLFFTSGSTFCFGRVFSFIHRYNMIIDTYHIARSLRKYENVCNLSFVQSVDTMEVNLKDKIEQRCNIHHYLLLKCKECQERNVTDFLKKVKYSRGMSIHYSLIVTEVFSDPWRHLGVWREVKNGESSTFLNLLLGSFTVNGKV